MTPGATQAIFCAIIATVHSGDEVIVFVNALPVVDDSGLLLGIVTSFDILLYEFKKEYPKPILFQHLFDQHSQETTRVSA